MEASRRERIILFGVVPIFAAVVGAVATVAVAHFTGGNETNEAVVAIVKDQSLTAAQKAELIKLANYSTDRFYTWLSSVGIILVLAVGYLGPALAARIRGY